MTRLLALLGTVVMLLGCRGPEEVPEEQTAAAPSTAPTSTASPAFSAAPPAGRARVAAPSRQGSAVARSVNGERIYVADEDGAALHVVSLRPEARVVASLPRPGCGGRADCRGTPGQVLALDGYVLASVRDPGLVVLFQETPTGLAEVARTPVAADAWGLALSSDERALFVTSPLHRKIAKLDVPSMRVAWTLDTAAEPRAVVVPRSGDRAYVSHLRGSQLTRIDGIGGSAPKLASLELDGARSQNRGGLAYALALSPDERHLYVPRTLAGKMTDPQVDVVSIDGSKDAVIGEPAGGWWLRPPYVVARDVAYRGSKGVLLVASEGTDQLVELQARASLPGSFATRRYDLGGGRGKDHKTRCGAPTGVALSADEKSAYVYCRTSAALAVVDLDAPAPALGKVEGKLVQLPSSAPPVIAKGRQLFYDARDPFMSKGASCATCHPEGRADGLVWTEVLSSWGEELWPPGPPENSPGDFDADVPLKTRVLAGRVRPTGFIGAHAEAKGLEQHLLQTFTHHRGIDLSNQVSRAKALVAFLSTPGALPTPSREARPATELEDLGRTVWNDNGCAGCHDPERGYTTGRVERIAPLPTVAGFDRHPKAGELVVPSLFLVREAGTWFHDGSGRDLAATIDVHMDRLSRSRLPAERRDALVAWISAFGTVDFTGTAPGVEVLRPFDLGGVVAAGGVREPPALPVLTNVPTTESPEPTVKEWKTAQKVPLPRLPKNCVALRIREWLRFHCGDAEWLNATDLDRSKVRARRLKGDDILGQMFEDGWVFPLRRGDLRGLPLGKIVGWTGKVSYVAADGLVLSETWPEGAAGPTLLLLAEPPGLEATQGHVKRHAEGEL